MARSRAGRSLTTRSPIRTVPSEISSRPATIRRAVVFPHPDGPTRPMNSPSRLAASDPEIEVGDGSRPVRVALAYILERDLRHDRPPSGETWGLNICHQVL